VSTIYNIYCDESGHLEHDLVSVMVLGAIWNPVEATARIAADLRAIKARHGLAPAFEIKWVKVSPAKQRFYLDLVDYFFDTPDLHFRALIVPDKSLLRHDHFGQDHDSWYYKMYFDLLKVLFSPAAEYRTYMDVKDTNSALKIKRLHDVLCNNMYDFRKEIIARVQSVRSHEVEQVQLADLLIGTVSYANRDLKGNAAKEALVARMHERSGYTLTRTTLLREDKVNLFRWHPRGKEM
jgi:hypothetical protein